MQVFRSTIRFGVQSTTSGVAFAEYPENWLTCERLGYDVAYATDHFVAYSPERGPANVLEKHDSAIRDGIVARRNRPCYRRSHKYVSLHGR